MLTALLGKVFYEARYNNLFGKSWTTRTTPKWELPEIRMPDIQIPERQLPSRTRWEDDFSEPETIPPLDEDSDISYVPLPLDQDTSIQRIPIVDPGMWTISRVDRQKIIDQEKALVEKRFSKRDTIFIHTPYGELLVRKPDFWLALREYKAEHILSSWLWWEYMLMSDGWGEYMKFVASSSMFAKKLTKQMSLTWLSKEKKIEAVLLCVQQKATSMKYKYDLNPDNPRDTTCFMRKPVVSLVDGLMQWYIWDCEDFATDFLTLCLAAWIPEDDLVVFHTPGHIFAGIKNFSKKHVDDPYVYIAPDGSVITPIEPTISADMNIETCILPDQFTLHQDTSYVRASTIGYPNHPEVTMRSKKYPQWVRVVPTIRK